MQEENLKLIKQKIGPLPIIEKIMKQLQLRKVLAEDITHERYVEAILVLIKNILCDHQALYRVRSWASDYDPLLVGSSVFTDDAIGRALQQLFSIDRSSFQTKIVLNAIKNFDICTDVVHNDSTTLKLTGKYNAESKATAKPKRGHSKDHRPDLKQILYSLTISNDFAVPIHYKPYSGNRTDDTTHVETWRSLRSLLMRSDFIYVADSKLCTETNMKEIDDNMGRFITIVPKTRKETKDFSELAANHAVRWERIWKKKSKRMGRFDIFEHAIGFYQLREGFVVHWFRSSEKLERDSKSRQDRISKAVEQLYILQDEKKRGPKSEKALLNAARLILEKNSIVSWVDLEITFNEQETFKQVNRGQPSKETIYRREVKKVPKLIISINQSEVDKSSAMDGIFPLTTNTKLEAKEVLQHYKYQPNLEKRFNLLKSIMGAAPVFLKNTERLEALTLVFFLGQLIAALIEREIRRNMKSNGVESISSLPEDRQSKHPTWSQVQRLFDAHDRSTLYHNGKAIKIFSDKLSDTQRKILKFVGVPTSAYK